MSFNWGLYLQLAQQLAGSPDEVAHRTAISRAYYAAFHAVSEHLKANNVTLDERRQSHEKVWSIYVASARTECKEIGNFGFRLRDARVNSDYKADKTPSANLLQRSLRDAQTIIASAPLHVPESFVPQQVTNPLMNFARCLKKCLKG
jgi:uncharacterized protein (UPF0332 family)